MKIQETNTKTNFNIFKILEKDDKELIHSGFIKYLLEYWADYFFKILFKENNEDYGEIELEKSHNRKRLDIFIKSKKNDKLIVIENKFKSFPNDEQLNTYDQILEEIYPNVAKKKYVICFDPDIISLQNSNWQMLSYTYLLSCIKGFIKNLKQITNDQLVFINHYINFLNDYVTFYGSIKYNIQNIFISNPREEDKFWMSLIYYIIRNEVDVYFREKNIIATYRVAPGTTTIPLLDIFPDHWQFKSIKFLIELQGNEIKFYTWTEDKKIILEIIDLAKRKSFEIDSKTLKYKTLTKKNIRSSYIYKEKMVFENNADLNEIIKYIKNYYNFIDSFLSDKNILKLIKKV
ncbi:MAG: PD-(D/E)XK nuclease family protein [Candidatus Delongbacteria bacterium]|nr:PD-(D/E)XK nuclease family protein [Candidatus Delongbacteria bacterium]